MCRSRQPPCRTALSLVELLAVILIVQILAALLLVGLQTARESARRTVCRNNLRQLGIGLENYLASAGSWPPAVIWAGVGEPLGGGVLPIGVIDRVARYGEPEADTIHANWVILLLPFLDQTALALQFDASLPLAAQTNAAVRANVLPVMTCPSDSLNHPSNRYHRGAAASLSGNLYARGNFAINVGPDRSCIHLPPTTEKVLCENGFYVRTADLLHTNDQVWGTGVAGANKCFSATHVSDGLSQTVALDEIRAGINRHDPRGVWALGQVGASAIARHGLASDTGGPNPCFGSGDEIIGCAALIAEAGPTGADCMRCFAVGLAGETNESTAARSLHPGGVHVLFCDASAAWIADAIDLAVWHALHTRNQAESATLP